MNIIKGPYLQDARKDSIIIRWETDLPAAGEIRIYDALFAHVPTSPVLIASNDPVLFSGENSTFHSVKAEGLLAGHDYYYEVFSETKEASVTSARYPFRTAPDETTAISFVVTAENGGCNGQQKPYMNPILDLIRREHPDFLLSVGDIVANGLEETSWEDCFFRPFRDLIATTPFYPCVGNHEVNSSAVPPENFACHYQNFHKYFAFPHYYSFDYGCAHFCVLDCPSMMKKILTSETDAYIPQPLDHFEQSEQYLFLEQDLAASNAKWKFVVFHYPPYTSSIYGHPDLKVFCPVFEKYGVDIVFNSHAIVYERSHPILNDQIVKNGVRYILAGGYDDVSHWFRPKQNGFAAKIAGRPNYIHVSLTPYTLELQAIDYEGKLFDMLTINKED